MMRMGMQMENMAAGAYGASRCFGSLGLPLLRAWKEALIWCFTNRCKI